MYKEIFYIFNSYTHKINSLLYVCYTSVKNKSPFFSL